MNAVPGGELPCGGIAGLRHWRHDLPAGLQVALLWTPFSLGVALASGAPAVAGLISAIVAGLLYPLLGGSHVTVSGPAAALAPVLLWGMLLLGQGDLAAGYPLVLVAIVLTGALQLLLAALRAGRYATMLPATVVEAMLAAIGIMIIVRQLPSLLGATSGPSSSVVAALQSLPAQLAQANWAAGAIGLAGLALMFGLRRQQSGWWRWLPAAIVVSVLGAVAAAALGLGPELRIRMPEQVADGLHWPAFDRIAADPELWLTLALVVFTFTMIDGVESVASVKAVDKIDPWRRQSDANKTLRAMGVCNVASGMIGGLTVIPNAVPSRANIEAGARTLWSNLYSGLALLLFALVLPTLLSRIPLAAIAAILVYIGWRLCEPALFVRMATIGRDRFIVFVGTVAAILATDLLLGMLIGVALELVLVIYLLMPSVRYVITGRLTFKASCALLATNFAGIFRSPVLRQRSEQREGRTHHVLTLGSLVGFNLVPLERMLRNLPSSDGIELRFTESARIIDHSAAEFLLHTEEEFASRQRPFAVAGLQNFQRFSAHPLAARMQEPNIAEQRAQHDERAEQMAALAARLGLAFDPSTRGTINRHGFVYLRRGDQREECNVSEGVLEGVRLRIFDYGHTSAPDYHVVHRHTLVVLEWAAPPWACDFVLTPGHYLERYLVQMAERTVEAEVPPGYRLYTDNAGGPLPLRFRSSSVLQTLGPLYLEARRGALLVFCPTRALESADRVEGIVREMLRWMELGKR
jgi:carbonic anhydrase